VTLPGADFLVRCAEAEFGFEMAADVPAGPAYTADTIRDFIRAAIPSIEIVDHRYHDWQTVGAPSLLADNAIHGFWVEGEPHANWRHIDFASHPTALVVNGTKEFPGSGAAVLGNPLNVVAWLANELPKFGRLLRRGDKITTGVTTGIYLAVPGDHLAADFGELGRVEMAFE
jgi:2-keto-4-pentenoate hydratase